MLLGLAERWCSDSNTFIFPWGEATITLEDTMVLGGYSASGDAVSSPFEAAEIERQLWNDLDALGKGRRRLSHAQWLNLFKDSGSSIEHEAFLSLWLSRFVFPGDDFDFDGIERVRHVFSMAVHLARGRRLAIGPPVLASIYRDLGLLKETMIESIKSNDSYLCVNLWSPLGLVKVWAWERFPLLRPQPSFVNSGSPRLARWDGLKGPEIGNIRPALDASGAAFLWRPYALAMDQWMFPISFYPDKEAVVGSGNLNVEVESFSRFLRPCQLVRIDCIEPYNPHRVAMQFGYEQVLPGRISWANISRDDAWNDYSKAMSGDEVLYLPPRLWEGDVTVKYLEWWRGTVLCPLSASPGVVKRRRSFRQRRQHYNHVLIDFHSLHSASVSEVHRTDQKLQAENDLQELMLLKTDYPEVPPRFSPRNEPMLLKTNDFPEVPPGFRPRNEMCLSLSKVLEMEVRVTRPENKLAALKATLF